MEIFGYICAVLMGFILGLLGGGGAILTVPILVYIFKLNAVLATGYSLFIVGISALFGASRYNKRKEVNYKVGACFAIPSMIGVFSSRMFVVPALPDVIFKWSGLNHTPTATGEPNPLIHILITKEAFVLLVFAIIMLIASFSMIRGRKGLKPGGSVSLPLIAVGGLFTGLVTGFVGAGGGFVIVPALVLLCGLEMKVAIGTSLTIIAVNSLFGFLGEIQQQGSIEWPFLFSFAALASVGILVGTILSAKVPSAKLKPLFGYFVLVMGLFILFKQF